MTAILVSGAITLVALIALALIVRRLPSRRGRGIAITLWVAVLLIMGAIAWQQQRDSTPQYSREMDQAITDLGDTYVLFKGLGAPDSSTLDRTGCDRGSTHYDHQYLQRTWRVLQPVDFPTLEAALERDDFQTGPIGNSAASAYGFQASRDDLAIQVASIDVGVEVRLFYGPCVPQPAIQMALTPGDPVS